jgi:iron complex outermembrane receptor protein
MKQLQSCHVFKRKLLTAAIVPLTLGLSSLACAQEPIEEVLVIGSYIKSSRSDAASPVDVIDSDFIEQSGAFTLAELTAKLSVNSGSENQADSFTSGETHGTSNINLRGLGLNSTLVLINGRRQTIAAVRANDGSVFVDTSTIPVAALDRIEILKEGATSAYGSDAVAGVINYILLEDFDGFEISGGYQTTASDSQDTTEASFLWGITGDKTRAMISGAILRQDPLNGSDRSNLVDNAISTLGRSFILLGPDVVTDGDYAGSYSLGENVPDPNCTENGGVLIPQASGARCGFFYGLRFNIVNEEKRDQIYGHISHEFSDTLTLGAELGYTNHEVLDNPQSPSYPNLAFPTILPGQAGSPFGVPVVWLGRPLGSDFPSPRAPRENDTWRAVLELDGAFNDNWTWNGAITYSENNRVITQPDTIKSRLEDGLAGVGGPNGDETFNVFDSSANSPEMIAYMSVDTLLHRAADLTVFDFVATGDLFELGAGAVGFAAGLQYRDEGYSEERNEIYTQGINPNTGEIIPVDLIFLGGGSPVDEDRQSRAIFAEMQLPVTDSLEVNLAARYEDLETDQSLDSKLALRWQATNSLVLRGSVSTAFREPSLAQFHARETTLQGLQDFNPDGTPKGGVVFVRVNATGNLELVPEESTNYNFGAIWSPSDSFDMRLDYWRIEYEDVITVENAQGKLQDDLNGDDIIRVAGDNSQLAGVNVDYINAAFVDTDGLDLNANFSYLANSAGDFGVRLSATHFLSYEIPAASGGTQDAVGFFNHDNFARSIPETKVNLSFDWSMGGHSAAVFATYVDSYKTTRAVPPDSSQKIDNWTTVDLQYAYNLDLSASQAVFTLGVKNAFDEAPPVVYDAANLSYDPKHHDPRGRLYYVRAKYLF